MKLTVNIDLEEIFCEEDETIKEAIKNDVVYQVQKSVREKLKEDLTRVADEAKKEVVDSFKDGHILEICKEVIADKGIKYSYSSDKMPLDEYLVKAFEDSRNYEGIFKHIDRVAENFSNKVKEKYDFKFAAQVVNKLSEQGLLKDDEIKKLIE